MMRSRRSLGKIPSSVLLDILILGFAAAVALGMLRSRTATGGSDASGLAMEPRDWQELSSGALSVGPGNAKITLVEFLDYRCPVCASVEGVVGELQKEHPTTFRRVVRQFPIVQLHPKTDTASLLAICAAGQGRFAQMHTTLFHHQAMIAGQRWDSLAALAGVLDRSRLLRCIRSSEGADRLQSELDVAGRFGISGTPTMALNGRWLRVTDVQSLRIILQKALQ